MARSRIKRDSPEALARALPVAPAPGLAARAGVVAYLSRAPVEQRQGVLHALQSSAGNQRVTAMLQRSPAPGAPTLPRGALNLLEKMGVSGDRLGAFQSGEMLASQVATEGGAPTITLLQLRGGILRGGILSIEVPNDTGLAVKAFFRSRQPLLNLAREMGLKEIELLGAAIHHQGIQEMVVRQGFTPSKEVIPESAGLGPADQVEMWSKRFPVHGGPAVAAEAPAAPAPSAAPAAAEVAEAVPAVGALPSVELPTARVIGGGGPPAGGGGAVGLGMLRIGANVAVMVAMWWIGRKLAGVERENVQHMFETNVNPLVQINLAAHRQEAEQLALADPMKPVYATVTVDIRSTGFTGEFGTSESVRTVTFVGVEGVSQTPVRREETIEDHTSGGMYNAVSKDTTRRVTYPLELSFDDPSGAFAARKQAIVDQRRKAGAAQAEAALVKDAQDHADAHKPARGRMMVGDREENLRWIRAYLAYTANRLDLQTLHDDAQRYLDEFEGHPHPWPDQSQAESMKPFMPN